MALMPFGVQGDTADRPSPVPRISKIKERAAAAMAPAKMAAHDTALEVTSCSVASCVGGGRLAAMAAATAAFEFMLNPSKS